MTAIKPPRVAPGQTIGVVAPAGPIKPAAREPLQRGLDLLGTFKLRVGPCVTAERDPDVPSYLAASDDARAAELDAMLRDPDIRAIVVARGGYGIQRILPKLDPSVLRADPKPIVGFSDVTALLAWAAAAGVRGIHGPVVVQLPRLPVGDVERLIALLTDPTPPRSWSLESTGTGTVRGPIVAANLTMASLTVATPWPVPMTHAIALFEEVGERPYEIDRYLTHLSLTGAVSKAAGVVVGDFTRCEDPNPPSGEPDPKDAAMRVVRDRLAAIGKRVALGAPVGHGDRNEALPFGGDGELDFDRGVLTFLDGAVA